ncbi:bile acid:sodium symporter family protein [Prauserella muralis]|uniref:Bile acid:sodium symporter n=1 Tax=Prauserella muralis TaxID=588067 RepID=A0A2V4ATA7_9PSEU|nr:bile acid:sodium symporter family protein [Prauserella muralis]PXY24656.1 bile acid:sodium symporter [Prauserella muralis]TWE27655.1 BASS family bile acid:Na+ symporter [Prauserella muralis]
MEQNALVEVGLPVALFLIMIGIGLTLTSRDFAREARDPRGIIVGTLGQIVLMPAVAFLIAYLLSLPAAIAVGLVIIAACPGGTTSNVIAYLARGNVALSIVLTVLASLITIVTLPIAANLALRWRPAASGASIEVPVLRTIALLVAIVLVPVAIGMAIRARWPRRAAALERAVSLFGGVVLAVLIVAIAVSLGADIWTYLRQAGLAAILLNLGGLAVGYGIVRLARLSFESRLTGAIELGIKNATLGILIAVNVIGSEALAVPSAVYGVLMYVSAIGVVVYGRRRSLRAATAGRAVPESP